MEEKFNKHLSLQNHLLIAMPSLNNTYFAKTVIILCEHDETGAMGLIINLPINLSVAEILKQMRLNDIINNKKELNTIQALSGGPVNPGRGFVLHYNDGQYWESSIEISEDLIITTSEDILLAIADNEQNKGPAPFLFILGYCEWQAGQLEQELVENSWLTMPADLEIIFNIPFEFKWRECTYNLGVNEIHNLSIYGGHA